MTAALDLITSPAPLIRGQQAPVLVLNADFRPLSLYPLSLWPWQEAVKAIFLDRVDVIHNYDMTVSSPSFTMPLPSVIALREYADQNKPAAFTRFHVMLRDNFTCQYCGDDDPKDPLTFDHIIPRCKGGRTTWENIVTACQPCNQKKGDHLLTDPAMVKAGMKLRKQPRRPTKMEIDAHGRDFPPHHLHETWIDYLYWDGELEDDADKPGWVRPVLTRRPKWRRAPKPAR
ncbi:MAG: HNH endonuclease [Bdellovibrionales bacterium]